MAKLSYFSRECLAVGFKEEFWSLKHLNFPSESSKRREKEIPSTANKLATDSVCFVTEI
jgi:hypothetical protein